MFKVIAHTPIYVWLLLVFLIWGGWKSRKLHVVSWKALLIMPTIMFVWSIYVNVTRYGALSLFLWVVSIVIGCWLGMLTVRKLNLRFDKHHNLIEIAGNWAPLILSLSIFFLRYFLGAAYGLYPNLKETGGLWVIENIATVVSGIFIGRLMGYWQRSKTALHIDLMREKVRT